MADEIKKINNTIASFMLLSFALSSPAFAEVNINSIAFNQTNSANNNVTGVSHGVLLSSTLQPAYGVPVVPRPTLQPAYGVPVVPRPTLQPAYGVPVVPPPTLQPAYGVPVVPDLKSNIDFRMNSELAKPEYNIPVKDSGIDADIIQINRNIKDADSRTPVGYQQPIIIPEYYTGF